MKRERYFELRNKLTNDAEHFLMWGSWVQISAFIATHKIKAPEEELDSTFKGQHMLYWVDFLATQYFEDEPEIALLSNPGFCEEMESTAKFSEWFINHMERGGANDFAKYQNALTFNSEYLDTL